MNFRRLVLVVAIFLGLSVRLCAAQEITIAAAADLQFVMQEVGVRFKSETEKSVKLIYGSSGNFAEQLQNGAPFDMFFSANLDYPKQLEAAGLTEPGTFYQYAIGKIVVWVPLDSKLDVSSGLKTLLNLSIKKIAIANPRHAHEYRVLEKQPLADDQVIVAGVIDTLTNFVEHPEVIADRIERVAEVVGDPTRVMAGTDCGFDTSAGMGRVAEDVVWAKLAALRDGARIAADRLFMGRR